MHPNQSLPPSAGWRWALLGTFAGALLAVLWGAPARWLGTVVRQVSDGRLQLQHARGTVWHGSARLVLSGGQGSRDASSLPGRLEWRWSWGGSGLRLRLSSPCCTDTPVQWLLQRSDGAWELALQDQQSRWPLEILVGLGSPWNTLQPEGQVVWQSQDLRLRWSAGQIQWHGRSDWQIDQLSSRLTSVRPMGSYRITLQAQPDGSQNPMLTLQTLEGPLQLSAQGQWNGQRWRFSGEARAETGHEEALSNLLNIIGRRDGARSRLSLG